MNMMTPVHLYLEAVDFSPFPVGVVSFGRGFLTSLPQPVTPWLSILRPFTSLVWMATIATLVCLVPIYVKVIRFHGGFSAERILDWMMGVCLGRGGKCYRVSNKEVFLQEHSGNVKFMLTSAGWWKWDLKRTNDV